MEAFVVVLRLGSRVVGRFSADLDTTNTLACAKGSLTEAAERVLGHKVVIKRFMVTIWGKTGYLQPEQEHAPLTECTAVMTSHTAVLDLGIPMAPALELAQCKPLSPMRRSSSSNSIMSACDHFDFHRESY